jgi:hypothetical protein
MATDTITKILKVSEFAEFADNFRSSERFSNDYNRCIDFLQSQTQAKQDKFWRFYDEQTNDAENGKQLNEHEKTVKKSSKKVQEEILADAMHDYPDVSREELIGIMNLDKL